MAYQIIRFERQMFPLIAMALFVPFAFLRYYFERVRPVNTKREQVNPTEDFCV